MDNEDVEPNGTHLSLIVIMVVVSNIFYFHPDPWGNDPI